MLHIRPERGVNVTALGGNPTNTGGFEMPMVELTTTKGALDDAAKQRLAGELSSIALEVEAGPAVDFSDDDHMQAVAWCFVNEQDVFAGGRVLEKPLYRITVTMPEGAPGLFGPFPERGRQILIQKVTEAVLAAEGTDNNPVEAHRVWVHLRFIKDGHWGGFGDVFSMREVIQYSLRSGGPGSKTERWREAALESVGAVSRT
jgi:phenylpyruvate tautomerase PptA (4-oxalocrotonate tautomerase family)